MTILRDQGAESALTPVAPRVLPRRAPVRLGIVGCGAVTQICHLPAAHRSTAVKIVALVDTQLDRARSLGRRFGVERCVADYRLVATDIDGMIVAVPHNLHVPIAGDLLRRGVPVLVEKPLATTVIEAERLIDTSRLSGTPLQVGHVYRHSRIARLVKRILDEGWLGSLRSFTLESGGIYNWPVASGFFWNREEAGGGVLIDTGSHMLDLLLWWIGDVGDVRYRDDNLGGVEADCELDLALNAPTGVVPGHVTFSRLRRLGSSARIEGEQFTLECRLSGEYGVRLRPAQWSGGDPSWVSRTEVGPAGSFSGMFVEQLEAFAQVIGEGVAPVVSGETALPTVALIERCYRERQSIVQPWRRGGMP